MAALLCVSLMIGLCGGFVYASGEEEEEVSSDVSVIQESLTNGTETEYTSNQEETEEGESADQENASESISTEEDSTPTVESDPTTTGESDSTLPETGSETDPNHPEGEAVSEEPSEEEPAATAETSFLPLPTQEEAQNYTFSGSGTEADPYLIVTAQDLAMLAAKVNYVKNYSGFTGKYFKQTADIDLSCYESWIPIGWGDHNTSNSAWIGNSNTSDLVVNYAFRGIYDGGGYTVSNMTIDLDALWSNPTMNNNGKNANFVAGLFGRVLKGSYDANVVSISNLTLKNATITADGSSGLFTATNRHLMIGGVVGHCQSKVQNVTVDGLNIQLTATSYQYASARIGGVVGSMQQTNTGIESCTVANTNISIDKSMSSLSSYVGLVLGWAHRIWFPAGGTQVNTGLLTIRNNQVINSTLTAKGNGYRDVLVGAYNPNAASSPFSYWAVTKTCTFVDENGSEIDLATCGYNLFSGCTINGVDPMDNQDLYNRLNGYTPSLNITGASEADGKITYTAALNRSVSDTLLSNISYQWKYNGTVLSDETGSSITRDAINSSDRLTCTMTFTYLGQNYTVTGTLSGTVIYVDQTNGSDTGDGTKEEPVKTIEQAYNLLAKKDTGSAETNVIQIVGNYTASRKGQQYGRESESNYIVFDDLLQGHTYGALNDSWKWTGDSATMKQLVGGNHVAATLRGDGGVISVEVPNVGNDKAIVQMGDLILENLTIQMKVMNSNSTMSGTLVWYCNGYNLTIGERVTIFGLGNCDKTVNRGLPTTLPDTYKNITIVGCSGMSLPIVAAIVEKDGSYYLDASKLNNTIEIASGNVSRVIGGARNGDTMLNYMPIWDDGNVVSGYYQYDALYGSNAGATKKDTYLWKSTVNVRGTAQVGLLTGGQTDNIFYGTSSITISENAQVGLAVAGSIGYGANVIKNWCDNRSNSNYYSDIKGSCELTLKDSATVYMMYGGSLGRNNFANATPSCAMRGDSVTLNIEGGTVLTDIYGGGAGGTMGTFSNESVAAENGFGTVTKACNVSINMTGGTVMGNIFGGGDGYYEFALQKLNRHPGWIAGDVTVTLSGGTVKGNVYGGGQGVAPELTEDVRVQSGITLSKLYSEDAVKTKFARISGNTTVTVKDNAVVEGTVYGGGQRGSIYGTVTLNIEGGTVNRAMGGNHLAGTLWNDVTVNLSGGTVGALYGGGEQADYVGVNSANKIVMNLTGGTATTIYGGGRYASVSQVTINFRGTTIQRISETGLSGQALVQRAAINGCLIGAGFSGSTETVIMNLEYGTIAGSIYGGSMFGSAGDVTINYGANSDSSESLNMTGSGFDQAVEEDASLSVHIPLGNLYGGGYGFAYDEGHESTSTTGYTSSVTVNLLRGTVGRNVFGGGYNGYTAQTQVNVYSDFSLTGVIGDTLTSSQGYLFGGGYNGAVGSAVLNISGGSLGGNVYGGGYSAATNSTQVLISGGTFSGNIFGGGYAGKVTTTTQVTLKDHEDGKASTNTDPLIVKGSVFGAGEGTTGTVLGSTHVVIDIYDDFTVTETNPNDDSSGRIITTVVGTGQGYGIIEGSVYGGGDLGQVGQSGTDQNGNATGAMGSATVTVKNGHIQGSVYGGGDGSDPRSSVNYEEEGAVYGTTLVNIWGGYVEGSIYGGGNQARIHGPVSNGDVDGAGEQGGVDDTLTYASRVIVDQNHTDEGASGMIAIGGSVFGGGNQGAGATASASVNTTFGDVKVELIGNKSTGKTANYEATIYFVTQDEHDDNGETVVSSRSGGGIYGEGNLCLVDGNKYLYLENLVVSDTVSDNYRLTREAVDATESGQKIKTIYSFQRADKVTLNHTQIALLGALDRTVDGDDTIYSINRAGSLVMKNGSTIKLYHIVNYLGALSSDVLTERQFIYKGNNGSNNYTATNPTGALTVDEIASYIASTGAFADVQKNVVCVANGLYLEVKDLLADKTTNPNGYGPVTGLFTLQLTNANPGEGGGYVYADIDTSTGDFICETKVQTDGNAYMPVVDNVGGYRSGAYTYYYWYIAGTSIFNRLTINGYIESQESVFSDSRMLPSHSEELNYHLAFLSGNDTLTAALKRGDYVLVSQQTDLTGKEIALEVKLGETSLGFLGYDMTSGEWYLTQENDRKTTTDLDGKGAILYTGVVDNTNDTLSLNLYLSNGVTAETMGLGVDFTLKLYRVKDNGIEDVDNYGGTKELSFSATVNILHMVPVQSAYVTTGRHYEGVETSSDVRITSGSSFTVSFETKYVPAQIDTDGELTWALSLTNDTYYMDSSTGVFLTVRNGTAVNCTADYRYIQADMGQPLTIYLKSDGSYSYRDGSGDEHALSLSTSISDSTLPAGTKITLVDYTNGQTPGYYYYVCEKEVTTSIDLLDFMKMGTTTTIRELVKNGETITFVTAAQDKTSRVSVEENLVFVVDFEDCDEQNYTGTLHLSHLYTPTNPVSDNAPVDIMDYRKADYQVEITNEVTTYYTRSYPTTISYQITNQTDGITEFKAGFVEQTVTEGETPLIQITVEEESYWENTRITEGTLALRLTLTDEQGEQLSLPSDVTFQIGDSVYLPQMDGSGVCTVSLPVTGERGFQIQVNDPLGSLEAQSDGAVHFQVELVAAQSDQGNSMYYEYLTLRTVEASYTLLPSAEFALNVTVAEDGDQILKPGEILSFLVDTQSSEESDQKAALRLEQKTDSGYTEMAVGDLFHGQLTLRQQTDEESVFVTADQQGTQTVTWKGSGVLKSDAEAGTYRLVVTYGDRTEYLNFIVYTD